MSEMACLQQLSRKLTMNGMNRPLMCASLLFIASTLLCTISDGQVRGYFPKPAPDDSVHDVSLIQLIAQPEKFDGKPVRLIGFLRIEFEGNAVYLHREDFDHGISQNGVWIDIPSDMTDRQRREVNMRYVICAGVFSATNRGHMGMFSGALTKVRRLEFWSDEPGSTKALPPPK
jgi:hypothetical protein